MSQTLRILYLAPSSHRAGQLSRYSFLDEEIRALAEAGVEAYVLSAAETKDWDNGRIHVRALPRDSMQERAATFRFMARYRGEIPLANLADFGQCYRSIGRERFAAEVVKREGISMIHSYFGWPRGYGGSLVKRATGLPLVAALRGSDVNTLPAFRYGSRLDSSFDRAFRRLLRAADMTVSVSEFVRRQALRLGANPETARVVLKGVRLDVFQPSMERETARKSLGAGSQPMILAVAGLVPIKGIDHILEALSIVRAKGHPFSFVVCGEGPERSALEARASRLGLLDCCRFAGKIPRQQITTYFAAADLFLHGSLIEASGNVLLEAMASGLPIVCTDAGGPAEYVSDGATGYVVPVADPQAMAQRTMRFLTDPSLRLAYGRAGRLRAESRFAYSRMVAETLEIYGSLLETTGRTIARDSHVEEGAELHA